MRILIVLLSIVATSVPALALDWPEGHTGLSMSDVRSVVGKHTHCRFHSGDRQFASSLVNIQFFVTDEHNFEGFEGQPVFVRLWSHRRNKIVEIVAVQRSSDRGLFGTRVYRSGKYRAANFETVSDYGRPIRGDQSGRWSTRSGITLDDGSEGFVMLLCDEWRDGRPFWSHSLYGYTL